MIPFTMALVGFGAIYFLIAIGARLYDINATLIEAQQLKKAAVFTLLESNLKQQAILKEIKCALEKNTISKDPKA